MKTAKKNKIFTKNVNNVRKYFFVVILNKKKYKIYITCMIYIKQLF